jgi:tetratricopeptide (TPR) repeat protein
MRVSLLSAMVAALLCGCSPAKAQTEACLPRANGQVDYQACADAAPKGSPQRTLALINLGTQAYARQDFANAARLYDEAQPPNGQSLFSDAAFHAYRADTYSHLGRKAEALREARAALKILGGKIAIARPIDPEIVYERIIPILKDAGDPDFAPTLAAYKALPARDWMGYANRAAVLGKIGDYSGALAANAEAMKLQPSHPAVLNTACYFLAKSGRPAEALPYCERAATAAPDVAPIHDSYAVALAGLGRCVEAEARRATARRLDPSSAEYRTPLACKPG